jgi:hypothetical protein
MDGTCSARMWEMRNAYTIFVGNPHGERPFGRHRRRRQENIKMDRKEIGPEFLLLRILLKLWLLLCSS